MTSIAKICSICIFYFIFSFDCVRRNHEIKAIDSDVSYPEGPVFYKDNLYYVSYSSNRILKWDGKTVSVFWEANAGKIFQRCGPASLIIRSNGNFLLSCYDTNSLLEISQNGIHTVLYKIDSSEKKN